MELDVKLIQQRAHLIHTTTWDRLAALPPPALRDLHETLELVAKRLGAQDEGATGR